MIAERTLKQWRKEALTSVSEILSSSEDLRIIEELNKHTLHMTQELLDLHLTREK